MKDIKLSLANKILFNEKKIFSIDETNTYLQVITEANKGVFNALANKIKEYMKKRKIKKEISQEQKKIKKYQDTADKKNTNDNTVFETAILNTALVLDSLTEDINIKTPEIPYTDNELSMISVSKYILDEISNENNISENLFYKILVNENIKPKALTESFLVFKKEYKNAKYDTLSESNSYYEKMYILSKDLLNSNITPNLNEAHLKYTKAEKKLINEAMECNKDISELGYTDDILSESAKLTMDDVTKAFNEYKKIKKNKLSDASQIKKAASHAFYVLRKYRKMHGGQIKKDNTKISRTDI